MAPNSQQPESVYPALRGISQLANSTGATLSIALPSGVKPGDLLIANIAQFGAGSASPSSPGWNLIDGKPLGNNGSYYGALLYKVASTTDAETCPFTLNGTSPFASGVMMAFSSVDTAGDIFDEKPGTICSGTGAAATAGPTTQTITVTPNAVVLMFGMAVGKPSVSWSGWTTTSSKPLAEFSYLAGRGTGNSASSFSAAWTLNQKPGTIGSASATLSTNAFNGSLLLALRPSYSSALLEALAALKAHITSKAVLTESQIAAHKATIEAEQTRFGSSVSAISAALDLVQTYDKVLGPLWVARKMPDRAALTDDIHYTIFTTMQKIVDWTYTSNNLANYPALFNGFVFGSSANFPGACTPPTDPNKIETAIISADFPDTWGRPTWDEKLPARKPTGTYLAPGSVGVVTVPPALVGKGYKVRVGGHSYNFANKPTIKRLDRVSLVYDIVSPSTLVANPLGGGIYIEVPAYVSDIGAVKVQIRNAVRSPYFSAKKIQQTSLTEWQNTERKRLAPWADFQSEKVMLQVPTSWISAMDDPAKLMADWDCAADICNDLMGFPHDRGKETMFDQVDLQIRISVYQPGYPTLNNDYNPGGKYNGYANSYLVRGPQIAPHFHFHELGHAYYFPKFPGENESVVNILHVAVWNQGFGYSLEEAFRKSLHNALPYVTLDTTAIAWMMCDNFVDGVAMTQAEKDYQRKGYAKWIELARLFGWEKLHAYYRSFNVDHENKVKFPTDVDSLYLRLSNHVGVDVRPLFHFWGVLPLNAPTLQNAISTAKLPASAAIYDTLVHYKTLIPADNAAFKTFAHGWWNREPLLSGKDEEEKNHARRWTNYDPGQAKASATRTQQIIDLYFPNGRPPEPEPRGQTKRPK